LFEEFFEGCDVGVHDILLIKESRSLLLDSQAASCLTP
jgi:hypothetical protein